MIFFRKPPIKKPADSLSERPLPPGMPQRVVDLVTGMRQDAANARRLLGEMATDRQDMQKIIEEGYRKGVFPIDQKMAADADEYQRKLKDFDLPERPARPLTIQLSKKTLEAMAASRRSQERLKKIKEENEILEETSGLNDWRRKKGLL